MAIGELRFTGENCKKVECTQKPLEDCPTTTVDTYQCPPFDAASCLTEVHIFLIFNPTNIITYFRMALLHTITITKDVSVPNVKTGFLKFERVESNVYLSVRYNCGAKYIEELLTYQKTNGETCQIMTNLTICTGSCSSASSIQNTMLSTNLTHFRDWLVPQCQCCNGKTKTC